MPVQAFQIPTFDLSTTSTTSFDLINANNQASSFNLMPWAGTVKRILIGHGQDIGDGWVSVRRYPNGVGSGIPGPQVLYSADAGPTTTKVVMNESFDKDDGMQIEFIGDAVTGGGLYVTVEVEFTLT